jgi:uncharacterized membrane protein
MIWIILALLTAVFESFKNVFSKMSVRNINEYVAAWSMSLFALPLLIPALLVLGIPSISAGFWITVIVNSMLLALASVLYMKALKASDLSVTAPMVTFTPLFLLLTSPLILGEFPRILGFAGILLVVLGSYLLNIREQKKHIFAPFKALLTEKGTRLMLAVAVIWSVTAVIDKVGIGQSSPLCYAVATTGLMCVWLLPLMLWFGRRDLHHIVSSAKILVPIGLCSGLVLIFQMTALTMTLVAYVISIKRFSAIGSVFLGWLIFKETGLRERLLGATVMVAGVILIAFS